MSALDNYQCEGQMSMFDLLNQDLRCTKTSPELSQATKEKTSESCLKKLRELRIKPPLFLDLRKESGQQVAASWEVGGPLLGEYMMHSFGECPKDAVESHLSQILSGGAAPEILFERQSVPGDSEKGREPREDSAGDVETGTTETSKCLNSWDVQSKHIQSENGVAEALYSGECRGGGGESYVLSSAISFQERAGKPGGGKGILIQNERTGALSTLNNQPVAYGICSYDSNSMKSANPKSGIYEADTSRTLDLNGGSPACNQGGIAVVQVADMYNGNLTGNVAATLNATSGDSPTHSGPSVCILNDQGGERMNCSNGVTSTLRAEEHGHQPIVCLEGNGSHPSHKGDGYSESETMYTLNSTEKHAVCTKGAEPTIASKASFFLKSRSDGTADTLVATDYKDPQIVCYGIDRASFNQGKNAKFGFSIEEDLAQTIVSKGPGGVMTEQ